jgi:hypothetical protein
MLGVRDNLLPINPLTNRQIGREISRLQMSVLVSQGTSRMLGVRDNPLPINPLTNRQTGREINRLQRSRTIAPKRIGHLRHNRIIVPR